VSMEARTVACPDCGGSGDHEVESCPNCGRPLAVSVDGLRLASGPVWPHPRPWNDLAVWSLALGFLQIPVFMILMTLAVLYAPLLAFLILVPSLAATVMGHVAIRQINADSDGQMIGKTAAIVGSVLGDLGVVAGIVIVGAWYAADTNGYGLGSWKYQWQEPWPLLLWVVMGVAAFFIFRYLVKKIAPPTAQTS
jgi:hypothetical protein